MIKLKAQQTAFEGLYILQPTLLGDERGYFMESYNYRDLQRQKMDVHFVQDNQSRSKKGVMRGLHYQNAPFAQTKLIRVLQGVILDLVVDLRKEQPTYGKHFALELTGENQCQLFIPKGFAHGFIVLSESAEILYKIDEYHNPAAEGGILYNDPALQIDWRLEAEKIILSERDRKFPLLSEAHFQF